MRDRGRYTGLQGKQRKEALPREIGASQGYEDDLRRGDDLSETAPQVGQLVEGMRQGPIPSFPPSQDNLQEDSLIMDDPTALTDEEARKGRRDLQDHIYKDLYGGHET